MNSEVFNIIRNTAIVNEISISELVEYTRMATKQAHLDMFSRYVSNECLIPKAVNHGLITLSLTDYPHEDDLCTVLFHSGDEDCEGHITGITLEVMKSHGVNICTDISYTVVTHQNNPTTKELSFKDIHADDIPFVYHYIFAEIEDNALAFGSAVNKN